VVLIRISLIEGRIPLKAGGEIRCSGRVSSSCSTSGTRRVNLVTNSVISREWGKDREVFTTSAWSGTYPWSFVTQIFHNGQPSHGGNRTIFEVMTSAYGVYISQMIRYSRACGSYQDFLDRGLLLTRKLLNQGFLLVKLKSILLGWPLWNICVTNDHGYKEANCRSLTHIYLAGQFPGLIKALQ
jgi:hypothetical protein